MKTEVLETKIRRAIKSTFATKARSFKVKKDCPFVVACAIIAALPRHVPPRPFLCFPSPHAHLLDGVISPFCPQWRDFAILSTVA